MRCMYISKARMRICDSIACKVAATTVICISACVDVNHWKRLLLHGTWWNTELASLLYISAVATLQHHRRMRCTGAASGPLLVMD